MCVNQKNACFRMNRAGPVQVVKLLGTYEVAVCKRARLKEQAKDSIRM